MAAYKHWRIFAISNFGGEYTGIAEAVMTNEEGGTTLCVGGTPTANAHHSSWDAGEVFDGISGDTSNSWVVKSQTNNWVAYEFLAPVSVTEVRITSLIYNIGGLNCDMQSFRIEASHDGINWVVINEFLNEPNWGQTETRTYTLDNTYALYMVSGITTVGYNVPVSRLIYIHNQTTGEVIASGYSDAITGEFSIDIKENVTAFMRVVDTDGVYDTEIRENLVPVVIEN